MKFILGDADTAAVKVANTLIKQLTKNKRTIWLVCGGSNIAAEVKIMELLRATTETDLTKLLILPMDERYGEPGHADSNYKQLMDAGFESGGAIWPDVLAKNLPLTETVQYYAGLAQTAFASADSILGVFGLGTDGHTAGVLPKTPAVYETASSVVGYDSPPYIRLTLTPQELVRTTTAFVLAYGDSKLEPLDRLRQNREAMKDLPSKLLYDIPEVYVYNDQLESEA